MRKTAFTPERRKAVLEVAAVADDIRAYGEGRSDDTGWLDALFENRRAFYIDARRLSVLFAAEGDDFGSEASTNPEIALEWCRGTVDDILRKAKRGAWDVVRAMLEDGKFVRVVECLARYVDDGLDSGAGDGADGANG